MAEIQNISGADVIPTGFNVSTNIPDESVNTTEEPRVQENPAPEENKGEYIDTYA